MPADTTSLDAAESSLCAVVRGIADVWRDVADPSAEAAFLASVRRHRLQPLVSWLLRQRGELGLWPGSIRQPLLECERAEAALEIVRRAELARMLRAFSAAGVEAVLFKGASFAYCLYPEPWLRPREDTDVIVRFPSAATVGDVLVDAGFRPLAMTSGTLVTHQRTYVRTDRAGRRHEWDVHWKIANPVAFADLVTVDEVIRASELSALPDGTPARMPSGVHALLLACLHRVSHHHDSADLLWLYDIHLLASRMSSSNAAELVTLSRRIGAGAICARGLRLARERFETALPPSLLQELDAPVEGPPPLPSAYLGADAGKAAHLMADLTALPGWRTRVRLIREHLFPPADYMLARYGRSSRLLLPALYTWRILSGARGWFRPPH